MQYARLGRSGLIVSRLAFGAMTFGEGGALPGVYKVDAATARTLVHRALDAGITLFDTADGYNGGVSEEWLGALLRDRRDDVVITTKVGFRTGPALTRSGASRKHVIASCEASLRRLGTDYVDLYLIHRWDAHTPVEETLAALDALVRDGKVRYVGFSNWQAWQAAKAVGLQERHGWARFVAAQMYYSAVGRDLEEEVLPFVEDAGIGTMVWSPLAGGLLTGKYRGKAGDGRLASFDILPTDPARAEAVLDAIQGVAAEHGASMAAVSLAWALHRPVTSVIVGASSAAQLDQNLAAAELALTPEQIARIDAAGAPGPVYPGWFVRRMADADQAAALARR